MSTLYVNETASIANCEIRRSGTRGQMNIGWLDARFSFSFGPYRNPARDRFSALQALNEDVIQPGTGFDMHPHRDLEIFIFPLSGAVEHRDSLGNHAIVHPGDIQKMTAGSGIWHSQYNASDKELDHHLQIWLLPRTKGLQPGIAQRHFDRQGRIGRWQILVSENGEEGSLTVDQDAKMMRTELEQGGRLGYQIAGARSAYLHVIGGVIQFDAGAANSAVLGAGDAVAIQEGGGFSVESLENRAELLLIDLPPV